ncbi:MAG: M67 family metallopeptidase [Solirubrobacteraceae bacterium]
MEIAPEFRQEIVAHALRDAPKECCGVVASAPASDGRSRRAARVYAAVNAAPVEQQPRRFEIDGRDVLALYEQIEGEGLELSAIYHSHTRTEPRPSQTDINFAQHWPGVEWIIVGVSDPKRPEVRTFLIDGAEVTELAAG